MPPAIPHRLLRLNFAFQKSKDYSTQRNIFIYCFCRIFCLPGCYPKI